ncbi:MAG: Cyclic pyranopterin monophosphate synthase [Deltaproteobacteria bacterium ADurb.BinA179]|nr:12,18-didecarboxysiroheme deacetylase [Deltaproteobacteria bacterium]MDI9543703.1 12,18-didecarboxysiroheme deacetylase [Pseudomonadota bacterium]NLW66655.1 12,18-didecarboxysiroheme deacetylase [Bacteriovoracaceae bacterium]OPZ29428.1 MAG: Cyclic pyranopterin monophosphate synthase [Deltaproteobacteria bacterium ADurb.BinA179]HRR20181.1 12,18-didecarboxysiroheme deacetylase [Desulfomonilia bacterium]
MIGISKLYCGTVEASDPLRYGRSSKDLPSHLLQFSADKKPVVVWNITSACNLKCVHCYAAAGKAGNELSTKEGMELIANLREYGSPVILFSGGEPLIRKDLPALIRTAVKSDMRAVISTNGTLITQDLAMELADYGLSYIGVSLDGLQEINDTFRGVRGAFREAMKGIERAMHEGIKVGLRFTMNRRNVDEIPRILDLMKTEGIPRICFYHLVYTGRAIELMEDDLSREQTRDTLDLIMDRTREMIDAGQQVEVLTVDNHADGPYVYLRMKRQGHPRADEVLELLKMNGGNSSGLGIGCVNWDGEVYPDQFWRTRVLGNVRQKPFSEIWEDPSNEFLMKLKTKKEHMQGRCRDCRWLDVCAGNFRARAEAATGDPWGEDPACYLTDEEIS